MDKQEFKSIIFIDKKIESKIKQAEKLREMALCVQSTNTTTDRVQSSRQPDPMRLIDRACDMEAEINIEIDRLVDLKAKAETLIEQLPPREALLMELRYLEGLSWDKVADRLGYEQRKVYRIHGVALEMMIGHKTAAAREGKI